MNNCGICGEPMPAGEEMFKFHGFSGPCPNPKPSNEFQTGSQTFRPKRTEQSDKDDEMFARLMSACRGVPHLATCMYETLKAAKLRIVPDDQ